MAKHGGDGFRGDGFESGGHTGGKKHDHSHKTSSLHGFGPGNGYAKGGQPHAEDEDMEARDEDGEMTEALAHGGGVHHAKTHKTHGSKHHKK